MGTLTPDVMNLIQVGLTVVVLFGGMCVGITLMVDSIAEMIDL